ncbi:sulfatase-like hydrolase/transferase [Frigidibacter sp. ROC022]|uniref:sulfatase-like hydrolase/transferase n=1 Tax=Frigidibacter sp. ROC022 TaxID=2971796 RepID=UPI00215A459E|nr:sulfatase-like hydrolase/transferase [Frigidibacter sp. ROC022]MCR8725780.1 sulfatase-like hydrolase/transferase [Frigidibacter sp. ROC022]
MHQPNIVVVLVDQMRRDALSCMGDPNLRTPHIDALAARGMQFTAANSTFPACVPFRFSMMTGHYAHSRNVPALGYRLSPAERTLGEAVAGQGYATAYIGKWHLYSAYGVSGGLNLSQAARCPIPSTHRRGFDYWRGFELRNDFYDTWLFSDDDPEPEHLEGHQTDLLFERAFRYIEQDRPGDTPFFLMLSVEAPHPPFMATPEHLARVRARGPWKPRPNTDMGAIEFFPPEWYDPTGPAGAIDDADPATIAPVFEANMQAYSAMIEQIDDQMGQLDACLKRAGLDQDTIVIFLSDHGELAGSHGQLGKAQPWEESVGVPLIVAGPGIGQGRRSGLPLCTEDLFPTFLGLAGGRDDGVPGLDLAPFLRGGPEPERDGVLLEFVTETRPGRGYYDETWRGIRTRRHKYTVLGDRSGARPWQLFDLEADPFEKTNLVDDPAAREVAADLHRRLGALLLETGDDYALGPAFGVPGQGCVAPA